MVHPKNQNSPREDRCTTSHATRWRGGFVCYLACGKKKKKRTVIVFTVYSVLYSYRFGSHWEKLCERPANTNMRAEETYTVCW